MKEYESNSHRSREFQRKDINSEEIKVNRVVNGNSKTRKRNKIKDAVSIFMADDIENIRSNILIDLVVPLIKQAIYGAVGIFLDGRISGGGRGDSPRRSYNRMYQSDTRNDNRSSGRVRGGFNYEDIIVDSRGDAEAVFDEMEDVIEQYGFVSIAQVYEIAGINENVPFSYNKWGWTNIRGADAIRCRDGYLLKLPKPITWD